MSIKFAMSLLYQYVTQTLNSYGAQDAKTSTEELQNAPTEVGADTSTMKLSATLAAAHGALSDVAKKVKEGSLPPDAALRAVEAALDIVLKVHGTAGKSGKLRSSS